MHYIPHVGDTVLVHHKDCHSNGATTVPAVVTQVFNQHSADANVPILCNLLAFPPFANPKHLGSVTFFSATPLIQDEHFVGCWRKSEHHSAHVGDAEPV